MHAFMHMHHEFLLNHTLSLCNTLVSTNALETILLSQKWFKYIYK